MPVFNLSLATAVQGLDNLVAFQLMVVGLPLEIGHHVRLIVEETPKPEQETAVILHRLMVVVIVVDQRQKLNLAILTTVQVFFM